MCTVILLRRPGVAWPLLLAANRDERLDRRWEPPAEFWPGILGGRDTTAGGTWMALNRSGVVATVLNRPGSLGPAPGKRSRGELPLLALESGTAAEAARAVSQLDAGLYRTFNLVIADAKTAWFVAGLGEGAPRPEPLPEGISMVTARPPNDLESPRTARHLPRFRAAPAPEAAESGPLDWKTWPALLGDSSGAADEALNVPPIGGFGTVCASLLALAPDSREWRFAAGPPDRAPFAALALP
jgi:hypothetical protein